MKGEGALITSDALEARLKEVADGSLGGLPVVNGISPFMALEVNMREKSLHRINKLMSRVCVCVAQSGGLIGEPFTLEDLLMESADW